ncbi:MAG: MFS transporter [Pleomorphochaeta sp.]
MKNNIKTFSFLAFAMYFLTGTACILIGSSLPQLVEMYNLGLQSVVLLGSAYALGRVTTVYITGRLVEKIGPIKVLVIGVLLISVFLGGITTVINFYFGMFVAFCGGMGMGAQDAVCPVLLSLAAKKNYSGALSAGQALFGLGTFTTPLIIGILLNFKIKFYYAYYILLIIPIIMLVIIAISNFKIEWPVNENNENNTLVKPLYEKNMILAYIILAVICASYSATVNSLNLYISTFAQNLGLSQSNSAFMLTIYNIGCVIGSLVFIKVLEHIKEMKVLLYNNIFAFIAIILAIMINKVSFYFILLFIAGFFLGVLFSVIVAIATRIGYKRISVAGSLVGTASGGSDILTPIITGKLVSMLGIGVAFKFTLATIVISVIGVIILNINTTEDRIGVSYAIAE